MVHAGGITEAKKILAMAEAHGQRSALHHMSAPVNAAACLHVDAAIPNFGIQEWAELEPLYELFPERAACRGGLRRAAFGAGARAGVRRGGGAKAAVARRTAAAALLAGRRRRRLLNRGVRSCIRASATRHARLQDLTPSYGEAVP